MSLKKPYILQFDHARITVAKVLSISLEKLSLRRGKTACFDEPSVVRSFSNNNILLIHIKIWQIKYGQITVANFYNNLHINLHIRQTLFDILVSFKTITKSIYLIKQHSVIF